MEKLVTEFIDLFSPAVRNTCFVTRAIATASLLGSGFVSQLASAAIVTAEYDNFFLQYDDSAIAEFGTPIVGGDSVFFLPTDMSVELEQASGYVSIRQASNGPWTTSFAVIPKPDFQLSSVTLTEEGDYSHSAATAFEDEYNVTARLFIRDIDKPSNSEFHQFDHSFGDSEETNFALWNHSETYSTASFSRGYWLTIQNTLSLTEQSGYLEMVDGELSSGDMAGLYLQKKFVGFDIEVTPVPLPASAWLMISALGMLGFASAKRRANSA